jgi:hypothetical protein
MGVNMKMKIRDTVGIGLIASLFLLSGCSSETPTAPTGGSGGGGTTPPVGAAVVVTVSNPNPIVSSTSTITATVTQDGQPVANGTAVEFSTNFGTFTDTAAATTIRTTTNGVATATLTATTAGNATVTVRVNNVSRTANVLFRVDGGGTSTSPTISSVSPATSKPAGGQVITITGTNFVAPVRVLFGTKEATIVSVSPTQIKVIAPSINLGATQQFQNVNITVITQAGSASEQSTTFTTPFRYEIEILTPVIYAVSPSSGPKEGNTRITIIGEGFQAPVKVYFCTAGSAGGNLTNQVELDVQQVTFGQIIAMTPPASGLGFDLGDGESNSTGQVVLRVQNVNSNTDTVQAAAFRYGPNMRITAVGPGFGPAEGGTLVTIDGWGFDDPVAVSIGGVAATPIKVSGTQIVARTGAALIRGCSAGTGGGVTVVNIEDASHAESDISFVYIVTKPSVVSISPLTEGQLGLITINNPGAGIPEVKIGDAFAIVTATTDNGDGTVTYSFIVPPGLPYQTRTCSAGGEAPIATAFPILFTNTTTGCATNPLNVTVNPPAAGDLSVNPNPLTMTTTTGTPVNGVFNIVNLGNGPLNVTSVTQLSGGACGISGPAFVATTLSGACSAAAYPVTFSGATTSCTAVFQVNSDNGQSAQVTVTATSTAPAGP